jgi:phage/plasmid primase-like uncharacterized protein
MTERPKSCPSCGAKAERLFRYDLPDKAGQQKWTCCACEIIWIPEVGLADVA